ncbi:predicted protein [Nematostella vectensis]|uniref:Uncharacterized protein n=1 Tax=Nematostella vectensis TaxID=45351 RepID=A7SH51_NEMVE|nr:predicted protein [Nematostella vectensis]|eukprot:XP_001629023.1 predicted protein [Nematostella vectensis]
MALDCYVCKTSSAESKQGWSACSKNSTGTCPSGMTKCIKLEAEDKEGNKAYLKGCGNDASCKADNIDVCKRDGVKCELNCCSGNLCNAGVFPVASGITLMACGLAALWMF